LAPLANNDLDPDFAYLRNYDDNDNPDLPDDFEMLFHEFETPAWNEDNQCFETTPELESSNPFANGFSLTPDHSSWQPFKSQQKMHPNHKDAGFYAIPGAYLGYKPDDTPNIYLHRLVVPAEVLFNKASLSDPGTLTWEEAMKESPENVTKWLTAADTEIKALEEKETWEESPLSSATVKVKVIPGTWVFRRKRDPQGSITKWKAQWVFCGDLQDVDFDTYASVVAWPTVHIFLILSLILQWFTKALDFDNAFVQAAIDHDVYTYLRRGHYSMLQTRFGDTASLRLKQLPYGISVAPKLWYEHLLRGLKELGFQHSSYDKCLLYRDGMLLVTFVDDCGLAIRSLDKVDWFVGELCKKGYKLHLKGDFTAFLGVDMGPQPDNTIHMHQSGLIKKIIAAAKMEDANPNWTPAPITGLGSDPEGPAFDNKPWRYSIIVGMLIYLCTNTRPDISFSVSQVAKYSKGPKQIHATAVKTIIRYLKQTPEKGMYIKFTGRLDLLLDYVDADFGGLFGHEQDPRNPNSARSRCGYIILLGGVPLF
jgi:hypothetical protein